ncbi:hypothetical protein SH1V18_01310 [Vallitalea longa]|uniref:Nucleotidyltransferase n=1 Tax=Vallitalea longa TaxID=2936439 RepID=A0A9W5Y814_9FIRM|nr:hypothetical protein [Vallitalea longa]GKX27651.1 hypothetical protein SH1V18_01310 [Vallitalea longa]
MDINNKVQENIELLQHKLMELDSILKDEIKSIIIDGSIIRGDFCDGSSDIDITITTSDNITSVKNKVEEIIRDVQKDLPLRQYPRKPLIYDIQWQEIDLVEKTGKRKINDWNSMNIPKGYPKLWLYAFDSIKHHKVIYGQDITDKYTRIPSKHFVPIRIERIANSVSNLGDSVSAYEIENGGITQIKNAWEAIRCICIANGLESISKKDVYEFASILFKEKEELDIINDFKGFYIDNTDSNLVKGDFRKRLSDFTLHIIEKYGY